MTCQFSRHLEYEIAGEPCPECEGDGENLSKTTSILKKKGGRPPKVRHLPGANLFLGSNPQPSLPLFDHTVDGKRKIHCRRYENCLAYAMKMDWDSFSCLDCLIEETMSKEAWKNDLEGLAALLKAWAGQ